VTRRTLATLLLVAGSSLVLMHFRMFSVAWCLACLGLVITALSARILVQP
jgi:hypothetical protein